MRRSRHWLWSFMVCCLLLLVSCGRDAPPSAEAPAAPPTLGAAPAPAPSRAPRLAVVVNEEELLEADVVGIMRRTGWPREKAFQVLVDAVLVNQESERQEQSCPVPAEPEACAKHHLGVLYSPKTLCKNISEADVDQGYQLLFAKDWPVEAYAGWLAEIRCCGGDWGDCDSPAAEACRQGLTGWGPRFEALSTAWSAGTPLEEATARLFGATSPLRSSDFFFTYWPESDPEDQPKLETWDPAMLAEIISLPMGEVSKPLRSTMGLHVFRLDKYKPARLKEDPEVRDKIREKICEERVGQVRDRYVRDLRQNATIRIP